MNHPEIYTEDFHCKDETFIFGWNGEKKNLKNLHIYRKIFFNILSCRMKMVIIKFLIYAYLFCGLMVSDCFGVVSKRAKI